MTMPYTPLEQDFICGFNSLAKNIHELAQSKGWWENEDADFLEALASTDAMAGLDHVRQKLAEVAARLKRRNDGEMLALIHSEVTEALEAIRHQNPPDDKIPEFNGAEAELADVVIRIMDMAHARGWDVARAIVAKHQMNQGRAYKHGGKAF